MTRDETQKTQEDEQHLVAVLTMTTPSSDFVVSRPFTVLIGWLGCQPKYLRRYESLYQGCDILTRIPTPAQVISATLTLPPPSPVSLSAHNAAADNVVLLQPPRTWPHHYQSSSVSSYSLSIYSLAWEILAAMDASHAPVFFLHIFSNGGGFVWEAMVRILAASHVFAGPVRQRLFSMEQRMAGVVVDSAPSFNLHRLPEALRWVPLREQWRTLFDYCQQSMELMWLYHAWNWRTGAATQKLLEERSVAYYQMWTKNPVTIKLPMLFLYSDNDTLAQADLIDEIVKILPHAHGIKWKESIHCAHLVHHEKEYTNGVTQFVQTCLERPDNFPFRAKL